MDIEANKALVRRYIEMWNTGKVELADKVLSSTWVDYAQSIKRRYTAFACTATRTATPTKNSKYWRYAANIRTRK